MPYKNLVRVIAILGILGIIGAAKQFTLTGEPKSSLDIWDHGSERRLSDVVTLADIRDALRVLCEEGKAVRVGGLYRRAAVAA